MANEKMEKAINSQTDELAKYDTEIKAESKDVSTPEGFVEEMMRLRALSHDFDFSGKLGGKYISLMADLGKEIGVKLSDTVDEDKIDKLPADKKDLAYAYMNLKSWFVDLEQTITDRLHSTPVPENYQQYRKEQVKLIGEKIKTWRKQLKSEPGKKEAKTIYDLVDKDLQRVRFFRLNEMERPEFKMDDETQREIVAVSNEVFDLKRELEGKISK